MEWFNGEPVIKKQGQTKHWICPQRGCGGEMIFNGMVWLTVQGGYHHYCDTCNYGAAMREKKYPSST
jgi:hypothetical protein